MQIRVQQEGSVWEVELRPSKGEETALDGPGLRALHELLQAAKTTPSCRVIVIEGQPERFCQGMDLQDVLNVEREALAERLGSYAQVVEALRSSSKATLCLVDGAAQGGGVGLLAATDMVIATERASFMLPECLFGLIPAMVMPVLMRRMPHQKARRLALINRSLSAVEAERLGLVDVVVSGPDALARERKAAIKRLLRTSPEAIAELKRYTDQVALLPCAEALSLGAQQTEKDLQRPATREAIERFMTGEPPVWFERYRGAR